MLATKSEPNVQVRPILDRALEGYPLTREDACALIRADGPDLAALMEAASRLRDRYHGRVVTYSRKVFIPLTNLCRDTCGYCTFVYQPDEPEAHTMTPDEVLAVARAGKFAGCKEALFSLGDKPEAKYPSYRRWLAERGYRTTLEYLRDMCELVLRKTGLLPHANPGLMTYDDIAMLRPVNASMGIMLENVSARLLRPGMAHHRCPDKVPKRRLQTIEFAGRQKVAFTTGILIGIGETLEERADSLFAIKELHGRYGHVQEVIVQNFRAKPDIAMSDHPEPDAADMARTIAVARLVLGPMNIQAPPNLTPREYGQYLFAGINDWGGISPVTKDFINPEAPWPKLAELRDVCAEAGFELRERLALYPEYVRSDNAVPAGRQGFVPEGLRDRIGALADDSGLVKREEEQW
ncbi:MAG: 7,8-didemethyl-8-hydroxy-5-deazariboflavin synthase CofG [Chloroflexi bacterium]|nr:7,8-didemethyl-8-hydroxy-5-deazariboflavin synthase CofG [Chloroflexota bacterium]